MLIKPSITSLSFWAFFVLAMQFYYSTDHLRSTVAITDEAGEKLWGGEYTALIL
ncbi:hypothetical protein [Spirochaeta cellobiosiphila]|uniref:hypothetical protein n=1 Tax=Spirochaeta cellobiosiphila TaxID=504483 RepID=UPI000427978F|nr:hypothetical protein [Spirochaeta cellobiosiphila]